MSIPYKRILLPLDGSEFAAEALPHAEEIARGAGAQLILFQVVVDPTRILVAPATVNTAGGSTGLSGGIVGAVSIGADETAHTAAMDEAKGYLDELAASLKHRKIDVVVDIDTGDPATKIVDYADANDIDLIVMSTHGRTGMDRWTHGSVATKVLQAASSAVLTMRPKSFWS
ncbi:universal stress protein [Chloroflexi bacterium TSY]|nr:universal stress protein [Chloroflexi bacterium TSY]